MNFQSATLHTLLLMGLTATPLLCVSPAAAQDVAASAVAGQPSPLPMLAEHRYRMLAKVRPLLFWISRDDVGGARITWRGDRASASGYELLIGSDPAKAPRRINRWGYIAEETRGAEASVLGVMKQSNEKSIEDAQAQITASGNYVFKAIRATAVGSNATAGVTTVRAPRDFTYHDLSALLQLVSDSQPDGTRKIATLPPSGRPGFLLALADLIQRSVDARGNVSKPLTVPYIYNGASHDLTLRHAEYRGTDEIGTRRYTNVIRSEFETRSRATGDVTRFEVTYGTAGDLAGVPVHAVYQPRWWFEVQLFLDDAAQF
jgi:hypothetical protein